MKYAHHTLLTLISLLPLFALQAIGQGQVSGTVNSREAKRLAGASVLILFAKDSSLAKGGTTNNEGNFNIEKMAPGEYLAVISSSGYKDQYLPNFSLQGKPMALGTITLEPFSKDLDGVTVSGKKPLFEQKIDRMVINVKSSITNAGGTVLDVLEKSPGVVVNRSSGAVSLNGKDGVMVMINGKLSYVPQEALVQMLNGMNATNVERIELITTPPAKYDAAGNAGYINIVLIENPDEGLNGSYSLSGGVGEGSVVNASTNLNYRKGNVNLYGSYSFSREAQAQVFENYRSVLYEGKTNEATTVSNRDPYQRNHNVRAGMDYTLNKKTVIGILAGGYDNKWGMDAVNRSNAFVNGMPDTSITINNQEINYWKNLMGNFNIQHTVKAEETVSFNADYLYYKDNNPTDYQNNYYNKNGDFLYAENTSSTKETIIKIFASQVDYSKKVGEKTNIEMGAKSALSKFTNDVLVQKEINGNWHPDPKYTANYALKENIYAAYLSGNTKLGEKTSVKAGLRFEYTVSNLGSETEKNIVDRKYGRLFPTFYISQQLNEKNTINFSYNRRIDRPSFTQLAPFLIFFDPKTFITGNPALQPAITDAIKLDYVFKRFVFSVSYSNEKNSISRFLSEIDSTDNTQITKSANLDKARSIYVSAALPVRITSWWNSQLNVSLNWDKVSAVIYDKPSEFSQTNVRLNGAESFTLPKQFSIELSGFYQSKGIFGAFIVQPFGSVNLAVQKKFNKPSSSLTFGIDNVLNTLHFNVSQSAPEQHIESTGFFQFSPRLFKLTWSQNFGNKSLKARRTRSTASDEERSRVEQ